MTEDRPHDVYRVRNTVTGRNYYGRSYKAATRFVDYHLKALAEGVHYNKQMQKEHVQGAWTFEVLDRDLSQYEANKVEKKYAREDPTRYNVSGIRGPNPGGVIRVLDESDVQTIREMYTSGAVTQVELAEMFNVSQPLISLTVNQLIHCKEEDYIQPIFRSRRKGREHAEAIREYFKQTPGTIKEKISFLSKKYGLRRYNVHAWVFGECDEFLKPHTRNLTNGPMPLKIAIDDKKYYKKIDWERENPGVRLYRLEKNVYVTAPHRTIKVDGVEMKAGENINATLAAFGQTKRVAYNEYVTVTVEAKGLRVTQNRDKKRELARIALLDPVLFVNGKINAVKTAGKHQINLCWIKALLQSQ